MLLFIIRSISPTCYYNVSRVTQIDRRKLSMVISNLNQDLNESQLWSDLMCTRGFRKQFACVCIEIHPRQ